MKLRTYLTAIVNLPSPAWCTYSLIIQNSKKTTHTSANLYVVILIKLYMTRIKLHVIKQT